MKQVELYTDGACSGNPGRGGYGVVLCYGPHRLELSGGYRLTTNNRMELMAAVEGLRALKEPCEVTLYSDSSYLINAFEKHWLDNWQRNGWKTSGKKEVENRDLWELLIAHTHKHSISWHKVKGHSDNAYNNRCDELARGAIAGCKAKQNGVK